GRTIMETDKLMKIVMQAIFHKMISNLLKWNLGRRYVETGRTIIEKYKIVMKEIFHKMISNLLKWNLGKRYVETGRTIMETDKLMKIVMQAIFHKMIANQVMKKKTLTSLEY